MRGLPGSGKSHIAKKLREIEAEQGGEPPRIHSIDDYFVTVSSQTYSHFLQEAAREPLLLHPVASCPNQTCERTIDFATINITKDSNQHLRLGLYA